jgi:hypothetical protein
MGPAGQQQAIQMMMSMIMKMQGRTKSPRKPINSICVSSVTKPSTKGYNNKNDNDDDNKITIIIIVT